MTANRRLIATLTVFCGVLASAASSVPAAEGEPIPGSKWRVHDMKRPRPPVVKPAETPGAPPADAIVLFDGTAASLARHWKQAEKKKDDKGKLRPTGRWITPQWTLIDGGMQVVRGTGDIFTRETFGDCQLHVEWSCPTHYAHKSGQGRGNSGVFLMQRYEVQVLDTYNDENTTYADGQAGAFYGQNPPLANPARPAGQWNVYDISFRAPRFDEDGKLLKPGYITVLFNGVVVQNNYQIKGPALHKKWTQYKAHPPKLPIKLQDHGDPVRFRNIWVRPLHDPE